MPQRNSAIVFVATGRGSGGGGGIKNLVVRALTGGVAGLGLERYLSQNRDTLSRWKKKARMAAA